MDKKDSGKYKKLRIGGVIAFLCAIVMFVMFGLAFTDIWWDDFFPPIFLPILGALAFTGGIIMFVFSFQPQMMTFASKMQRQQLRMYGFKFTNKVCPYCGKNIDTNAKFCSYCGKNVAPKICGSCGAENAVDSEYCAECGARLDDTL